MHVVSFPAAFFHIARHPPQDLSPKAQERLPWLNCWQALRQQGLSATKAGEVLGLPRSTLYRWQRQLNECGLKGLEDKRRRPKHLRRPMWDPKMVDEILRLREEHPWWGKAKLAILIKRKKRWEWTHNHVRRGQALNRKSPAEYLMERHPQLASVKTRILAPPKLSNM